MPRFILICFAATFCTANACGQGVGQSPEIRPDGTVILRASAPGAHEILLNSGVLTRATGHKDAHLPFTLRDDGVWELTLQNVPFDIYAYTLQIDGASVPDPLNPAVQVNAGPPASELVVTDGRQYFDPRNVPHGTVTRHTYHSRAIGGAREAFVYTPPGYSTSNATFHPVLYLLGGNGQRAHSWSTTGRLPWIADNLIAEGLIVPMVIVMIDAHAEALQPAGTVPRSDPDARAQNAELFERDLVEDLMPLIESHYRVASDRHGRALAGLSLGATLADVVGLSRRDLFASFGMFSGGGSPEFAQRHATLLSEPERTNREVDLLFLGTGRADPRPLAALTSLHQIFNERGVHHDFWTDSPEGHNWSVWRPLLAHGFLPRLFRGRTPTIVRHAYRQTAQRELELACYLPHDWRREDRRPAVVFFFGGGFWTWNVDQFAQQADYFARRGLVSILADYRTGEKDGTKPPAAFEDARAAMRWIRSHATQLGIDPHRVAASGGSAGGSLAASLVITNGLDAPGDDHTVSTRPDLLLLYNPGLPSAANARTVQRFGDEYTWRRTAAALHVGPDWPPSLLLYGSEDNLLTGGHALAEALHALRIRVELDVTAGVGHGFFNLPTHLAATTSRADRFFQELGWLQAGPFVPLPSGPASLSDSTSNPERGRQTDP